MNTQIQELYELGMEKFAGDESAAKDFVKGFLKEAFEKSAGLPETFFQAARSGAGKTVGTAAAAFGVGLGIHGISSMLNSAKTENLRTVYQSSLSKVVASNPLLHDADQQKLNSYAETIFKFAPHVACDANLLSSILAHINQGEGIDPMIIRTLTDLEAKLVESKKNALFSPKSYL